MSFDPAWGRGERPVVQRRRRGPLLPTIAVLVALVVLVIIASNIWTEVLWYSSVGFTRVFTTTLAAKALLFVVGGLLAGAVIASSLIIGYRTRPVYAPVSAEQASLDRYRESVEPLRRLGTIAIPIAVGLLSGAAAADRWPVYLLWLNRVPFGRRDPQFHLDVGFFVFTLPWLRFVLGFLTTIVVLAAIAAAATHYLYGGLRLQGGVERTTTAARVHLSLLVAAFVLLRAGGYWLDRYALTTQQSGLAGGFSGLTYTDANAVLPAKTFLTVAAAVVGLLFIGSIWLRSWRLPGIAAALLVVCAIVVGGIYPAAVQRFQVSPSQASKERLYIERNIAASRAAYGLQDVEVRQYNAQTLATSGQLRNDAATVPSVRLLDPALVSDSFRAEEQIRQYYAFPDSLDVDRYTVDGKVRDTVIAVREIKLDQIDQTNRNWLNDHTVYTHGFGVVAAYGNRRANDGKPVFYEGDIPPTGALGTYEPRVYFGESSPEYSIVGAPSRSAPWELDYPDTASNSGQKNTTYTGKGGVAIGSLARKVAYAIKYQEQNILLSDRVTSQSRILYHRNPRERVQKVAPWLTLDGDPYPAVVNGRIQWILDGFTTTNAYPNSSETTLESATADSLTARSASVQALANRRVNYIRNSVKATVDAYDGTVTLYAWDESDPLLKAWSKAFPGTVQPLSKISGQLMSHLRYPEDLFKVQREVLRRYHVTDPGAFYGGQDFWRVPADPTTQGTTTPVTTQVAAEPAVQQPAYFLTLQMPGTDRPSFSLTTTYVPPGSNARVLTAFAAVDADAGSTPGKKRDGYGKLRVLELPKDTAISGPGQVQNNFNANTEVKKELQLANTGSSRVINGNLLTLPVGGGLLYVQPVYVRGTGETSYPLLQKVLVSFGDKIGFADTLDEALDQVFGGNSGATAGDAGAAPTTGGPSGSTTGTTGGTTGGGTTGTSATAQADLRQALSDAQQAIKDSQAALAKSDFAAYGQAQARLADAVQRATDAQARLAVTAPPASPTPSPSK